MDDLPRRVALRRVLQIAAAVALAPAVALRARAADSCVDPASESLRGSLHYAAPSPTPNQTCSVCSFFTRDEHKAGCGQCTIMSGPVDEKGHCDSWSPRS